MTVNADNATIGLLRLGNHWSLVWSDALRTQFYAGSKVVSNRGISRLSNYCRKCFSLSATVKPTAPSHDPYIGFGN
jgi:hypothetical protein